MSQFFDKTETQTTADEAANFEQQAGARLLEYMRGIALKAVSKLSPEARSWFKVDLSPPLDWFDPEYPHLVLGEIERLFHKLPKHYPAWINFSDKEQDAVNVLLDLGKAVRAIKGIDPQKALQILDSGVLLGHSVTKAHVMPWEPYAQRDALRQAGTRKPRKPEIDEWIEDAVCRMPDATRPELWAEAPDWIRDQIGRDRFLKRVSAARKK